MAQDALRVLLPRAAAALSILLITIGCGSVPERNPVPEALSNEAYLPGIKYARFWGDTLPSDFEERLAYIRKRAQSSEFEAHKRTGTYLAISGGGANGAFGAGLLAGWTEAGDRPEFDIVTGISTGALIAPFAFLGPEYDATLREVYTAVSTDDILKKRGILAGLTSDAMADSEPLGRLIAKHLNDQVVEAIAREYEKGRALLIGTTNLDAGRPVIWSIGAIAASRDTRAPELIRKILLASASIPGAFPPVMIDVEADGQTFDEIHVDGGAASQVFLYPAALDFRKLLETIGAPADLTQRVYVLRNSKLGVDWNDVDPPKFGSVVARALSVLFKTQGVGDLYRIYLGALRDRLEFYLAYIPTDFAEESKEPFDPEYMQKLFKLGYERTRTGYPWDRAPPGMEPPEVSQIKVP